MTSRSEPSELSPSVKEITARLDETGVAAELVDPDWRLQWVSPELRALTGAGSDEELGLGRHFRGGPARRTAGSRLSEATATRGAALHLLACARSLEPR